MNLSTDTFTMAHGESIQKSMTQHEPTPTLQNHYISFLTLTKATRELRFFLTAENSGCIVSQISEARGN